MKSSIEKWLLQVKSLWMAVLCLFFFSCFGTLSQGAKREAEPTKFTASAIEKKARYQDARSVAWAELPKLKSNDCFSFSDQEIRPTRSIKPGFRPQGGSSPSTSTTPGIYGLTPPTSVSPGATVKPIPILKDRSPRAPAASPIPDAVSSGHEWESAPPISKPDVGVPKSSREKMVKENGKQLDALPMSQRGYYDWGAAIYLSNDDSMSLSSAQRVLYTIDNFLPLPPEHIRPHELLNYFSFDTAQVEEGHDFSVLPSVKADDFEEGAYSLGLSVAGRPENMESRRNIALTWVLDRSGSMGDEGRMEYLQRGLNQSLNQLKNGDMLHMVLFDHDVCVPVENFVVGRDDIGHLEEAISKLSPMGSTDLHSGLVKGYKIADTSYVEGYNNRVVLITDALANTGVTDEALISTIAKYYDTKRIRLSGIGVGSDFNDSLLDKLTERGRGAYLFLGSGAEVDAVFGYGFISLIETVAVDVHFRLHLPNTLRMKAFYGEESSTEKEDVQAIHYFANTSQLFLSDVEAKHGKLWSKDDIMLSIEYGDPETEEMLLEEYVFNIGEIIAMDNVNSSKGRMTMAFIDMLSLMASRPVPPNVQRYGRGAGSWADPEAFVLCEDGEVKLADMARELQGDPEVLRVQQVWAKYCSRYERPRNPVKRDSTTKPQKRIPQWPGAQPLSKPKAGS